MSDKTISIRDPIKMYIDNDDKLETFFLNNYSLIIRPLIDVPLTPRDPQYDAYDVSQH